MKRICTELNALSAQITRTRKVEVQEEKPLRVPQPVDVHFDQDEASFYDEYFAWCKEGRPSPGHPSTSQCRCHYDWPGPAFPQAARAVLEWGGQSEFDYEAEENAEARAPETHEEGK